MESDERDKKRDFILKEFYTTESTYVERLQLTVQVFVQPLREMKILDANDVAGQFGILEKILTLHAKHIGTPETFSFVTMLEDVTLNFQLYSDYMANYEPLMQRRYQLVTGNRKFSDFVEKSQKDPAAQGQALESLLILPVQRIPRYRLLLEQLLKYTPETHDDHSAVTLSLEKICEMANYNNEAIRARENRSKIMSIMMQIEPRSRIDLLDDRNRRYLKDDPLSRQCRRGLKEFHFWLFTDYLLYGQGLPIGGYMLNRKIKLSKCSINMCDSAYEGQHAFMVHSPEKSFIVYARTSALRDEWVKAIVDAIDGQRERISHQRGSMAPVWTPDAITQKCQRCNTHFSILFRRHHCRNCGAVICDNCGQQRFLLPHLNTRSEVRVCKPCFEVLSGTAAENDEDSDGELREGGEEGGDEEENLREGITGEEALDDFNQSYDVLAAAFQAKEKEKAASAAPAEKPRSKMSILMPGSSSGSGKQSFSPFFRRSTLNTSNNNVSGSNSNSNATTPNRVPNLGAMWGSVLDSIETTGKALRSTTSMFGGNSANSPVNSSPTTASGMAGTTTTVNPVAAGNRSSTYVAAPPTTPPSPPVPAETNPTSGASSPAPEAPAPQDVGHPEYSGRPLPPEKPVKQRRNGLLNAAALDVAK